MDKMKAFGWDFVPTGPNEWEWVKFDNAGNVCAREGSKTWHEDIKEAGGCDGYAEGT